VQTAARPAQHINATPARYQISHYPAERIALWTLADGRRLLLRPVLPQDAAPFATWLAGMTSQARRQRFHGACNGVSGARLAAMTDVDHLRHVAFVVIHVHNGRETLVAEARYQLESGNDHSAEFAVLVDEGWLRLGIGARALHALLSCAASQQLRTLNACVGADNQPMQALALRCGFAVQRDRDDETLVRVEVAVPAGIQALTPPEQGRTSWLRRLLRRQAH
jgi:acetyltransferase